MKTNKTIVVYAKDKIVDGSCLWEYRIYYPHDQYFISSGYKTKKSAMKDYAKLKEYLKGTTNK